ncbi:MAG: hypothetical protein EAZ43_08655 [Betaproteobacteria bacterium]|nr:MAG: hypothetical protein EAZ43_08655 [Betaproteobacteria bacterium]
MELRPLLQEEVRALRAMIEERVDQHLQSSDPQSAFIRGAPYAADWSIGCLNHNNLERVRWLLSEIGFTVRGVTTQSVQSDIPGVHNEFFVLIVQREVFFLPDCLWGEALLIEGVACSWGAHVERFNLANDLASRRRAYRHQYGPMGKCVA